MKELAILKIRESTEAENAILFEWDTFRIFCILARPAAFVYAMQIKFNTAILNKLPTRRGHTYSSRLIVLN